MQRKRKRRRSKKDRYKVYSSPAVPGRTRAALLNECSVLIREYVSAIQPIVVHQWSWYTGNWYRVGCLSEADHAHRQKLYWRRKGFTLMTVDGNRLGYCWSWMSKAVTAANAWRAAYINKERRNLKLMSPEVLEACVRRLRSEILEALRKRERLLRSWDPCERVLPDVIPGGLDDEPRKSKRK